MGLSEQELKKLNPIIFDEMLENYIKMKDQQYGF